MHSFSQRLLISVTLLLLLFFGVMVVVLDMRFRIVSENALRDLRSNARSVLYRYPY